MVFFVKTIKISAIESKMDILPRYMEFIHKRVILEVGLIKIGYILIPLGLLHGFAMSYLNLALLIV